MKVVVFGPSARVGALVDSLNQVVDLNHAATLRGPDRPVPSQLQDLIEGGDRALDAAEAAVEYALGHLGPDVKAGQEPVVQAATAVKIHRPQPSRASRIACAGGNYAQSHRRQGLGDGCRLGANRLLHLTPGLAGVLDRAFVLDG
jgi:hypothetical protein